MSLTGNGVIGIRREDKNKWERRVPLAPHHVKELVASGVRVLVQPSNIRVYPNNAYVEAGAEITEDLSPASTILAVKEVPISLLIPNRTYLFFSHTIKAQPANMPLLDALLEKKIRMIDYECITEGGLRGAKRLVAFGQFAGIAGMVDFLRGVGERYLSMGYSTPFLNIAAMYMYPSVAAAMAAVKACGDAIAAYGLPEDLAPFTAVFTGRGNVSMGAQEVFNQLPVKWVDASELAAIRASACGRDKTHVLYATVALDQHMVRKNVAGAAREYMPDAAFDRDDYRRNPDAYYPIFHEFLAPHMTVLVNSMYWEPRFPRLLTIKQAQELKRAGRLPLIGVSDITCDFEGSVEFLKEFTTIEQPFYVYDVVHARVMHEMDAPGILYHAVDHLPSECPKDASDHFGKCLLPFVKELAASDGSKPFDEMTDMPPEMKGAILCSLGELAPNFQYITKLRKASERAEVGRGMLASRTESFLTVDLVGHLFDTGIINKVLDLLESKSFSARILDFHVGKDRSTPTEMRVQVFAPGSHSSSDPKLSAVLKEVNELCAASSVSMLLDVAESHLHSGLAHKMVPKEIATPSKRILVLGAGFVSAPLVDYLLRRRANHLTVASMIAAEAEALASTRARVTPVQLDVFKEADKLERLIQAHDLVVSLVPAPCHPGIAKFAIKHHRHMVTASYIAPEMKALHEEAQAAGVTILNEAGLDPGIDHMSAKKMIDEAVAAGATIVGFSSVCGGLPAPESANNPLGYKFSWSPRGVLTATRNTARYRRDGKLVEISGDALLASAVPFRVNPAFSLECIPNRDSLPYAELYGIDTPALKTMFRGTLRYAGFCAFMHGITALGLLDLSPATIARGATMRDLLAVSAGVDASVSNDDLFAAVLAKATSGAKAVVSAHLERLAALSPQLADMARAAAAVSTNVNLDADVLQQAEFRKFLEWAGFFSTDFAPLRGADAGDGISTPKIEHLLAGERLSAGAVVSTAPMMHVPLDTMVVVLTSKPEMSYDAGERDMALMQHELEVAYPDGRREMHISTLIEYANLQKSQTAMARTVGFTAAIGAQLILDGRTWSRGVVAPLTREWYGPMLEALEGEGIAMKDTVKVL